MNEAELLFTEILNCDRQSLYLNRDLRLNQDDFSFVSSVFKRRLQGEPIQYILGKTEFMGWEFKVTPDVFIPRPETEVLAEKIMEIVQMLECSNVRMLDLGTGSGCIAVSLAKSLLGAEIYATDISNAALKIAKINARFNKVDNRTKFIESDLFASYELRLAAYDLIVSNPPYILASEIEKLQPEISYEPRIALDGGEDGLNFYLRIIEKAPAYLKKKGLLILEIGFGQKDAIKNIFQKANRFEIIEIVKDYNNIDRVIVAKRKI